MELTPLSRRLLQFASPQAAEYGKPEDTERRVGGRRKLETEKRIGHFSGKQEGRLGHFHAHRKAPRSDVCFNQSELMLVAIFKYAFFSAIFVGAFLVLWWVLALVGLPIPAPPVNFSRYLG